MNCTKFSFQSNIQREIRSDSITYWIKQSKADKNSFLQKKRYLLKAYQEVQPENDINKNNYLSKIAYQYLILEDTLQFKKVNEEAYQIAKEKKDTLILGDIHWNYAYYYYKQKTAYDSAYYHYNRAYHYFSKTTKQKLAARMLYNMSLIRGRYRDYAGSEGLIIKAIKIYRNLEDYASLYACYNHLALLQKDIKEYNRSIKYHNIAMNYLDKIPYNKNYLYTSLNNLGRLYTLEGRYIKAIENFESILKDSDFKHEDIAHYARVLDNLAYCKLLKKDTTGIKKDFYEALQIREKIENTAGVVISKIHLSKFYSYRKDTANAFKNAKEANRIAKRIKNSSSYLQTLSMLSVLDKKNTEVYLKEYITYNDSLQQIERKVQNKFARIEFETDKYIERTQKLSEQKIKILIIGMGLVIIISLTYYAFIQRARNKNLILEQEKQDAQSQLTLLAVESQKNLEKQKIQEQNRISEEIHDNIIGQLFGVRFGFGFLNIEKDKNTQSKKEMLMGELQKIEAELRDISHQLNHNINNYSTDYSSLIEEEIKEKSAQGNFEYQLNLDPEFDWDSMGGIMKINCLRIIQESLLNIVKYAQATNVMIMISEIKEVEGIKVSVEDNGIGFDILKVTKGIGLKNIESRVKKLNGGIQINTQSGKGTRISFYLLKNE